MKSSLNIDKVKRSLRFVVAVFAALVVELYFSVAHDYLIPITALFVMLTPVGNVIYQGVLRYGMVIFFIVFLSFLFPPHKMVYLRLYDASLGAAIGILSNMFVFPRRADSEFRASVLPLLNAYTVYFVGIIDSIFEKEDVALEKNKKEVELQLLRFPDWVFARGFDSGLKTGHQYFLIKLFQISGILFAMHHASRCRFDDEVMGMTREPLMICCRKIKAFFDALMKVFDLQKLTEGVEDFESDLHHLDTQFQALLPMRGDLLDMSQEDVMFYEVIYALSDLRKALIKLGQALRP